MIALLRIAGFLVLSATPSVARTQLQIDFLQDYPVWETSDRFAYWKQMAKGKLNANRTDSKKRALEKLEAARGIVADRTKELENGRGTLDFLHESSARLLEAELKVCETSEARVAAFERHWRRMLDFEQTNQRRYNAERISSQDLAQTRYERIQAELGLIKAREGARAASRLPSQGTFPVANDPLEGKDLAKSKRAVLLANPTDLTQSKSNIARIEWIARHLEFLNARGTLNFLLDASRQLRDAEYEAGQDSREKLNARERYWQRSLFVETVCQGYYDHGRCSIRDLMRPRYWRCDAERRMILERPKNSERRIPDGYILPGVAEQPLEQKGLAKQKWRATTATADEVAREKLDAAEVIVDSGMREFVNGRGTLIFVLESLRMFVEAANDVDPSPAARAAAVSQYWELAKIVELINWERNLAGRITLADYLETKYDLLTADELIVESMNKARK